MHNEHTQQDSDVANLMDLNEVADLVAENRLLKAEKAHLESQVRRLSGSNPNDRFSSEFKQFTRF